MGFGVWGLGFGGGLAQVLVLVEHAVEHGLNRVQGKGFRV